MKLLIVIVNYRSADLTIDCLRSLEGQLDDAKVIVTDNKSPDDSVNRLNAAASENRWGDWLTIMPLDRNGGFAYGNNAAIAPALNLPRDTGLWPVQAPIEATAIADSNETHTGHRPVSQTDSSKPDFILLLNPDTIVRPGAIKALLDFMTANPKVGIAGSRLEDPDGTPQRSAFRFHSIAGEFERGIRMGFVTRMLSKKMIAPPVSNETGPCDWVAGASMIVRREVFETAGLMDERYFMYFEEVDFCLTAKRKGWPCWYVPASRVVHLVGAVSQLSDSRKHRARRPGYWFESRRRYFVKNHGWLYAALADLSYLAAHTIWRTRRFLQGKEDTDPPKLLLDSVSHSVFLRGWTV
jgi:N-acetylglucosaminyl-diphospho-decaprenol L-rhamnosyltransferase